MMVTIEIEIQCLCGYMSNLLRREVKSGYLYTFGCSQCRTTIAEISFLSTIPMSPPILFWSHAAWAHGGIKLVDTRTGATIDEVAW